MTKQKETATASDKLDDTQLDAAVGGSSDASIQPCIKTARPNDGSILPCFKTVRAIVPCVKTAKSP